jgi:hypothetical protein
MTTTTVRVPQTFDLRPSVRSNAKAGSLGGYPDELMIDWGNVPRGSTASIYWPQAKAIDVVRLGLLLYSTANLKVVDLHTISCTVNGPITFIPIPFGSGGNFSGLFTIELPQSARRGQTFQVVVRRITTKQSKEVIAVREAQSPGASTTKAPLTRDWRFITGTFQITIPISSEHALLHQEENTLAIMKWRLENTPANSRWHPVLKRYLSYIAGRVTQFGGNPGGIAPSQNGLPTKGGPHEGCDLSERTGKICEIIYDCFGDFEGFVLDTCCERHRFASREKGVCELIMRTFKERLRISVYSDSTGRIRQLVVS